MYMQSVAFPLIRASVYDYLVRVRKSAFTYIRCTFFVCNLFRLKHLDLERFYGKC